MRNAVRVDEHGNRLVQAAAHECLTRGDFVSGREYIHPAVGRLLQRFDQAIGSFMIALEVQAVANETVTERLQPAVGAEVVFRHHQGFAEQRLGLAHPAGQDLALRQVQEGVVHPQDAAGGAHLLDGTPAFDFGLLGRAASEGRDSQPTIQGAAPQVIGGLQPPIVRVDHGRPVATADIIDIHGPERMHDRKVATRTRCRGIQHRLGQRQQLLGRIEPGKFDVEISLRDLQGQIRAYGLLGETFQQAAHIADALPEDQLPTTGLLRQGHGERDVVSRDGMLYGLWQITHRRERAGRAAPQDHRPLRRAALQPLRQKVRKQRMVAKPLARIVERDEQRVEMTQLFEQVVAIATIAYGVGERGVEALENGGLQQELAQALGQVGDDLLGEVIGHLRSTAGEILQCIGLVPAAVEPKARKLQRHGPSLRTRVQKRQVGGRNLRAHHLRGLLERQRKVAGIELHDQAARQKCRHMKRRTGTAAHDQVKLTVAVLDEDLNHFINGARLRAVEVIEDENRPPAGAPDRFQQRQRNGSYIRIDGLLSRGHFERPDIHPGPRHGKNHARDKTADFRINIVEGQPAGIDIRPRPERPPPFCQKRGLAKPRRRHDHRERAAQALVQALQQGFPGRYRDPLLRRGQFANQQPIGRRVSIERIRARIPTGLIIVDCSWDAHDVTTIQCHGVPAMSTGRTTMDQSRELCPVTKLAHSQTVCDTPSP